MVQLPQSGTITIVQRNRLDGWIYIYDSSFQLLKGVNDYGQRKSKRSLSIFLNPGKYYFRCFDSSAWEAYTITVSFVPGPSPQQPPPAKKSFYNPAIDLLLLNKN